MPDVSETGQAFDVHGRRIAVGHDEGAVYLDTGLHRYLYDAGEREQFMKAWAEAERRAEAHSHAAAVREERLDAADIAADRRERLDID